MPVGQDTSRFGSLGSLGSLASLAGISPHTSAGSVEILALLKSDVLKKEVIEKYHLLPILLYKSWDKKKNRWKKPSAFSIFVAKIRSKIGGESGSTKKLKLTPDMDDGIKALGEIFDVSEDKKLGTIDMSIEYPDPKMADRLLSDIIATLKNHLTAEAIRIAKKKNAILEKELLKTADPTIQQSLYKLIASNMATITTAKVSENFAFKVVDPPYSPEKRYKPKRTLIVIVAFVTSLILSIFILFFVEFIKNARKRTDISDSNIGMDDRKQVTEEEE